MAITVNQLVALAFLTVIAVVLYILPLVLEHAWWSLMALLPLVFAPVPWLCVSPTSAFLDGDQQGVHWAEFLTAFCTSGVLGIPAVLFHVEAIPLLTLVLNLSGSAVLFLALGLLGRWQYKDVDMFSHGPFI